MGYEIDYIAVGGDGERSGDAIAFRYGDLLGENGLITQTVVVIDGGTKGSANTLVNKIKTQYETDTIHHLFSTHPDMDHISGIKEILEQLTVQNLYIHIPWNHIDEIKDRFKRDFTVEQLNKKLQKEFELVNEVVELALNKGVTIVEPFVGEHVNDNIHIVGPTRQYYEELLCQSDKTPETKTALEQVLESYYVALKEKEGNLIHDNVNVELLDETAETSPENNSSVILYMHIDGRKLLFTGDAGIPALTNVATLMDKVEIPLSDLSFFHVPHHGSKHNLSNSILKKIKSEISYVSAAKASPKHPSKRVTNALIKNGSKVYVTRGANLFHQYKAPPRIGLAANEEDFYYWFIEN
jgi:beta-lactamase superfamily II metal-dependent hydrolase